FSNFADLEFSKPFQNNSIRNSLNINCEYFHYQNLSLENLKSELCSQNYQFKKLWIVFDLTQFGLLTKNNFTKILTGLSDLYENCSRCAPFMVTFDLNSDSFLEWTKNSFRNLSKSFQSILINS